MIWQNLPKFSGITKNLDRKTGNQRNFGFSLRIVAFWYWPIFGTKYTEPYNVGTGSRLDLKLGKLSYI